jgi:FtsZ-binding cell division protein ZapB
MNESDVLVDLEQRIASLEVGATYDASKEAIEKVEMEFLIKLREIRAALLLEQQHCATDGSSASLSNNTKTIMESLQQENDMLKKKTTKLEYRIQHLVANMEEMYQRTSKSTEVN